MREIPRPHQNFFISGYSPVFYRKKNESQFKKNPVNDRWKLSAQKNPKK